jgi:hypothetical protein
MGRGLSGRRAPDRMSDQVFRQRPALIGVLTSGERLRLDGIRLEFGPGVSMLDNGLE